MIVLLRSSLNFLFICSIFYCDRSIEISIILDLSISSFSFMSLCFRSFEVQLLSILTIERLWILG